MTDVSTYRLQAESLLNISEESLLLELGKLISPPLGIRKPKSEELIAKAKKWFDEKQLYLRNKICGDNSIKQFILVEGVSNNTEITLLIISLIMPDFHIQEAVVLAVLVVKRGLKALCSDV